MYIILETFWKNNIYVVDDEQGNTLIFNTKEEAEKEAADLQKGLVVEI